MPSPHCPSGKLAFVRCTQACRQPLPAQPRRGCVSWLSSRAAPAAPHGDGHLRGWAGCSGSLRACAARAALTLLVTTAPLMHIRSAGVQSPAAQACGRPCLPGMQRARRTQPARNVRLADLHIDVPVSEARCIVVVANGLPLRRGTRV